MSKKPYPLRIPAGLLRLAEMKSTYEHSDKATALRQWLFEGAESFVLELLGSGRLTVSQAAELLEMSVHDVHRLAEERGTEIGADAQQYGRARETAELLVPRHSG